MSYRIGPMVLAFCVANLALGGTGIADKDVKALLGKWRGVELEFGGEKSRLTLDLAVTEGVMDFDGDKRSYKLDPSKSPKEIDLIPLSGAKKGKVFRGIYEFEKGNLRICYPSKSETKRPTEFRTTAGDDRQLITLKRAENK